MSDRVTIRFMDEGEEQHVCALVARVFDQHVAGDFAPEGVREFYRYAEPTAMAERTLKGDRETTAGLEQVSVHASLYAVPIY